jgi:hypothetical protein
VGGLGARGRARCAGVRACSVVPLRVCLRSRPGLAPAGDSLSLLVQRKEAKKAPGKPKVLPVPTIAALRAKTAGVDAVAAGALQDGGLLRGSLRGTLRGTLCGSLRGSLRGSAPRSLRATFVRRGRVPSVRVKSVALLASPVRSSACPATRRSAATDCHRRTLGFRGAFFAYFLCTSKESRSPAGARPGRLRRQTRTGKTRPVGTREQRGNTAQRTAVPQGTERRHAPT